MEKLSVIITTYNEAHNIREVIASVAWADEVLVVDSYSTDGTPEAAKATGAKVLQHPYENPAAQKNWAIPQASYEWVLILDADERVTQKLQSEIQEILKNKPKYKAYRIFRLNHFMGRKVRYSGWQSDSVIRLIHRDTCRYAQKWVHEEIDYQGEIKSLKNKLLHYTYTNLPSYLDKMDRYTTWGAKDRLKRTRKVGAFHLLGKPVGRFFRHYVLRLGFLDGKIGLVVSLLSAYSVFQRNLKLMRMTEGESFEEDDAKN